MASIGKDEIIKFTTGLSPEWKDILLKTLNNELAATIGSLNKDLALKSKTLNDLSPKIENIFNCFQLCSYDKLKVVLIGQDPYIGVGEAMGLSFSVPMGKKIPPSLLNIYKCLIHNNHMKEMPTHGDLTGWAAQGVLLMNTAMTTYLFQSGAHVGMWSNYTSAVIREISLRKPGLIFILLGAKAQVCIDSIQNKNSHTIVTWGHPSPLNPDNRSDGEKSFKYCPAFNVASCIKWDPNWKQGSSIINDPIITKREFAESDAMPIEPGTFYLFTDGACSSNGKPDAVAACAFYITTGTEIVEFSAKMIIATNQRAELAAILYGMEYILQNQADFEFTNLVIVSDSKYSISCIESWYESWERKSRLDDKKNIDIIAPAYGLWKRIQEKYPQTSFVHTRGHLSEPEDSESREWFIWRGNDIADKLCTMRLQ